MDHEKFLTTFFEAKPEDLYMSIWTSKDKMTSWHNDVTIAVNRVNQKKDEDVYFSIGLTKEAFGAKERGSRSRIVGIMGLHLDIDIKNPVHKKQDLPSTIEEAMSIVSEMELRPSIVVNSGYGLHVYFLFKEPWVFEADTERQEAEKLLKRCHATAQAIALKKGWSIDSVFDLARVMRVPGTTNTKNPQNPVMAKIIELTDARYEPDEIGDHLIDDVAFNPTPNKDLDVVNIDGLIRDRFADPPADKLDVLLEIEPQFKATWQGKRGGKYTASHYDFSIVRHCAEAGWSDQEIINTCIARRRRHGEEPEKLLNRPDLVKRLILHAIKCREESSMNKINEYQAVKDTPYCAHVDAKNLLVNDVSKKFKLQVNSAVRYNQEPPYYMINTEKGEVPLPNTSCITNQQKFRDMVATYTGHIIPRIRGNKDEPGSGWDAIAQILLNACENVDLSPDQTRKGAIKADLREYFEAITPADTIQEAYETKRPVFYEGRWHIRLDYFSSWVRSARRPDETNNSLARQLTDIFAKYKTQNIMVNGKRTTRGFWVLPELWEQDEAA